MGLIPKPDGSPVELGDPARTARDLRSLLLDENLGPIASDLLARYAERLAKEAPEAANLLENLKPAEVTSNGSELG